MDHSSRVPEHEPVWFRGNRPPPPHPPPPPPLEFPPSSSRGWNVRASASEQSIRNFFGSRDGSPTSSDTSSNEEDPFHLEEFLRRPLQSSRVSTIVSPATRNSRLFLTQNFRPSRIPVPHVSATDLRQPRYHRWTFRPSDSRPIIQNPRVPTWERHDIWERVYGASSSTPAPVAGPRGGLTPPLPPGFDLTPFTRPLVRPPSRPARLPRLRRWLSFLRRRPSGQVIQALDTVIEEEEQGEIASSHTIAASPSSDHERRDFRLSTVVENPATPPAVSQSFSAEVLAEEYRQTLQFQAERSPIHPPSESSAQAVAPEAIELVEFQAEQSSHTAAESSLASGSFFSFLAETPRPRSPVNQPGRIDSPTLGQAQNRGPQFLEQLQHDRFANFTFPARQDPVEELQEVVKSSSPTQEQEVPQGLFQSTSLATQPRGITSQRSVSALRAKFENQNIASNVAQNAAPTAVPRLATLVDELKTRAGTHWDNSVLSRVSNHPNDLGFVRPFCEPARRPSGPPAASEQPTTPNSEVSTDNQHRFTPPEDYPDLLPAPLSISRRSRTSQGHESEVESPLNERSQRPPPCGGSGQMLATPSIDIFVRSTDQIAVGDTNLHSLLSRSTHLLPADHLKMEMLQVRSAERSSAKTKAIDDARAMQASVIEDAKKSGKDPPKYVLVELIGKGSFGRVYKGKDMTSAAIVAVKIIDIDEGDTLNPRLADTYSEFMKEVNALKILSESKARNVNHVIEALPVGKAMWMITEYCGGGSVATLMKPTPRGLKERWIIPILREVAEAVKWVHQAGIIHRDIKCANVLITEEGGVQLCDFGVAGITETTMDKRSTFIGTMNWMAPELFDPVPHYGKEVDIWAFGSMAYEMATGYPPNAMSGLTGPEDLGPYLKQHIPRLEGPNYSEGLRSIVAFCLEEKVSDRPMIEAVQKHGYIYNTSALYPASSLSDLVRAFKKWEDSGGTRKSLFMRGGAQGPLDSSSATVEDDDDDYWNFSTTAAFDQVVAQNTNAQDIINVYGRIIDIDSEINDGTSRPPEIRAHAPTSSTSRPTRRRPPPEALAPLKAPLEKLFDPNTISNYEDNARSHYHRDYPMPTSDLPLRDDSAQISIRDTMIDLGEHDLDSGLSSFSDMDTIKASRKLQEETGDDFSLSPLPDFSRPALSDPADNLNRRTQDWKFPSLVPPASADPELSRFPTTSELQRPAVTPGSGARPALTHHPTEPISVPTQGFSSLAPSTPGSPNRMSLIDLDLSLPEPLPEPSRPSTADSTLSSEVQFNNPFDLEKHTSTILPTSTREPSLYIPEDSVSSLFRSRNPFQDLAEVSDFSASDAESTYGPINGHGTRSQNVSIDENAFEESQYSSSTNPSIIYENSRARRSQTYDISHLPQLSSPPSVQALTGSATHEETKNELEKMLGGLTAQLEAFRDVYETLPAGRARREKERKNLAEAKGEDVQVFTDHF